MASIFAFSLGSCPTSHVCKVNCLIFTVLTFQSSQYKLGIIVSHSKLLRKSPCTIFTTYHILHRSRSIIEPSKKKKKKLVDPLTLLPHPLFVESMCFNQRWVHIEALKSLAFCLGNILSMQPFNLIMVS